MADEPRPFLAELAYYVPVDPVDSDDPPPPPQPIGGFAKLYHPRPPSAPLDAQGPPRGTRVEF